MRRLKALLLILHHSALLTSTRYLANGRKHPTREAPTPVPGRRMVHPSLVEHRPVRHALWASTETRTHAPPTMPLRCASLPFDPGLCACRLTAAVRTLPRRPDRRARAGDGSWAQALAHCGIPRMLHKRPAPKKKTTPSPLRHPGDAWRLQRPPYSRISVALQSNARLSSNPSKTPSPHKPPPAVRRGPCWNAPRQASLITPAQPLSCQTVYWLSRRKLAGALRRRMWIEGCASRPLRSPRWATLFVLFAQLYAMEPATIVRRRASIAHRIPPIFSSAWTGVPAGIWPYTCTHAPLPAASFRHALVTPNFSWRRMSALTLCGAGARSPPGIGPVRGTFSRIGSDSRLPGHPLSARSPRL